MTKPSKVLILGSGPIVIGQAAENYSAPNGAAAYQCVFQRFVELVETSKAK